MEEASEFLLDTGWHLDGVLGSLDEYRLDFIPGARTGLCSVAYFWLLHSRDPCPAD